MGAWHKRKIVKGNLGEISKIQEVEGAPMTTISNTTIASPRILVPFLERE